MNGGTAAIIPARGGSKRLPRKNLHDLFGRPLLAWAVETCQACPFIEEVCVSSEDSEILDAAVALGCTPLERPPELAGDHVPKMEAVRHAVLLWERRMGKTMRRLVVVQANSPDLCVTDLSAGHTLLVKHQLWEVLSVSPEGVQNAAFRWMDRGCLFNTFLSAHVGMVACHCSDAHTADDLDEIRNRFGTADSLRAHTLALSNHGNTRKSDA